MVQDLRHPPDVGPKWRHHAGGGGGFLDRKVCRTLRSTTYYMSYLFRTCFRRCHAKGHCTPRRHPLSFTPRELARECSRSSVTWDMYDLPIAWPKGYDEVRPSFGRHWRKWFRTSFARLQREEMNKLHSGKDSVFFRIRPSSLEEKAGKNASLAYLAI